MAALALTLTLGLLAGCGGSSTPAPSGGEEPSLTVVPGKLHMATNAAFPPYEMPDDAGGYEGIDIEIAEAIAAKLGLELVIDDMDFSSVITAVQTGKADMAMAGLTVNEERKQNVDFTEPYATGVQVIIVTEDSEIQSVDDLEGKMIGTQEGTTGTSTAQIPPNGGTARVLWATNGSTAVQALQPAVDCVVIDEPAKSMWR